MTQDELAVLEELLTLFASRGLTVNRIKMGSIEVDFSMPASVVSQIHDNYTRPMGQKEQEPLVTGMTRASGYGALFPGGQRPKFRGPEDSGG